MTVLPITRVVLYKHGVGYFERQGSADGDATVTLTFKQAEVSDVLKSLTVLDLEGGHIASVSYDSTKPLEQLLAEVALSIPDENSLTGLLPQLKGARMAIHTGGGSMGMRAAPSPGGERIEGVLLGVDTLERQTGDGISRTILVSLLTDEGKVRSFDLHQLAGLEIEDAALRRDLDYYLRTQLSAKKKETRTFTFFAQGQGNRTIRISYTLEAPVWKATYRILLGEKEAPAMIQGWAVVDNTQDEDWENVQLSLVAGLPVSFVHDLYTPRYIRRPVVAVKETTGVLPPEVEEGMVAMSVDLDSFPAMAAPASPAPRMARAMLGEEGGKRRERRAVSSTPAQVRERALGDLFEYEIEHPVTIRRNQSALVPIVLRAFQGRPVLLYNKQTRAANPMRCVEFENTTGLTLEGGPVTVLEAGSYVGEAMLDTLKPGEKRLVPFAVELSVSVLDNVGSHEDRVYRVVIRRGQLETHFNQVQETTYTISNKSDQEQTLYLDHLRQGVEWKLLAPTECWEVTENYWRFRFVLPARKVTRWVVRQEFVTCRHFALVDVADHQLAYWVEQRYLDKKTEQVLRQAAALRQQGAGLEEKLQQLQQERATIHGEQVRIRENLQALGDRPTEKELRERFVRSLNAQEDRLERIERETNELIAARDRNREQMNNLLAGLEYEAAV